MLLLTLMVVIAFRLSPLFSFTRTFFITKISFYLVQAYVSTNPDILEE